MKKSFFLIYVKDLNVLKVKQSIIDKVVNKESKKNRLYLWEFGSTKNKKQIKKFFLDFFNKNSLKTKSSNTKNKI